MGRESEVGAGRGRHTGSEIHRYESLADELAGGGPIARVPVVVDGPGHVTRALVCSSGPPVLLAEPGGILRLQLMAEHLAEEVVVAKDRPCVVEPAEEEVRRLHLLERDGSDGGVVVAEEGLDHDRVELVGHARLLQETTHLGGLVRQRLGGEVAGDRLRGAGQLADLRRRIVGAHDRQRGQVHTRRPPLGSSVERGEIDGRGVESHGA